MHVLVLHEHRHKACKNVQHHILSDNLCDEDYEVDCMLLSSRKLLIIYLWGTIRSRCEGDVKINGWLVRAIPYE